MAVAQNRGDVLVAVHAAGRVAHRVETGNGLALGVEHLHAGVDGQTTHNLQQNRAPLQRDEGTLLDGEEQLLALAEIAILAKCAALVIARNRLRELLRRDADLLGQLLKL